MANAVTLWNFLSANNFGGFEARLRTVPVAVMEPSTFLVSFSFRAMRVRGIEEATA